MVCVGGLICHITAVRQADSDWNTTPTAAVQLHASNPASEQWTCAAFTLHTHQCPVWNEHKKNIQNKNSNYITNYQKQNSLTF